VISQASHSELDIPAEGAEPAQVLVRYGTIPQVARYKMPEAEDAGIRRGLFVVVETERGQELGEVLEILSKSLAEHHDASGCIIRAATSGDRELQRRRQAEAAAAFEQWEQRISEWDLELQLVDIEHTLDGSRTILYVLNNRGAETTRLALLAAAGGLGIVNVQPVTAEGVVQESGGGCGSSCGCGDGH